MEFPWRISSVNVIKSAGNWRKQVEAAIFEWSLNKVILWSDRMRTRSLHRKWSFPWRISSVNVIKSAGNWRKQVEVAIFEWSLNKVLLWSDRMRTQSLPRKWSFPWRISSVNVIKSGNTVKLIFHSKVPNFRHKNDKYPLVCGHKVENLDENICARFHKVYDDKEIEECLCCPLCLLVSWELFSLVKTVFVVISFILFMIILFIGEMIPEFSIF